ncbi:hypothetical protein GCM10010172_07650 [Paractinoplanes ferrugineus]|uniref:Uncharacterized protein n=1 Tax=Paractinoplanes ferrugineus TaxID=113564 RepID=A0A919J9Z1_9ACTN|nr:hypothetical protein [Actinoplanes ferrugineus]GIE16868.1 hypothetical protein Afe05nite_87080 [Actinoplanes ferrugineus]
MKAHLEPYKVKPIDTNNNVPLTCGHKHVTGDTIHVATAGRWKAICDRCHEKESS